MFRTVVEEVVIVVVLLLRRFVRVFLIIRVLDDGARLFQQRVLRNLDGFYLFFEEHLVVAIAVDGSQQPQVGFADDEAAAGLQDVCYRTFVAIELAGILAGLVVAEESADEHAAESVGVLVGDDVEVAHQIVREVILRHLVEQLVLVDAVRLIGQQEDVVDITLEDKAVGEGGVAIEVHGAARPDVVYVELSPVQLPALLDAADNHSRQFADLALRILLHHLLHPLCTAFGIALVQQTQTLYEEELRTVLALWEAVG